MTEPELQARLAEILTESLLKETLEAATSDVSEGFYDTDLVWAARALVDYLAQELAETVA